MSHSSYPAMAGGREHAAMNARRWLYLLALAGLLIPWAFNLDYLRQGGSFAPGPFLQAVAANSLTAGITWDVYLAATAFSAGVVLEGPRPGARRPWLYVLLTFGVGLAVALPLYLARTRTASRAP